MSMEFSEDWIKVAGAVMMLVVSLWFFPVILMYCLRGSMIVRSRPTRRKAIVELVYLSIMGVLLFVGYSDYYNYPPAIWVAGVGTLLELVLLYPFFRRYAKKLPREVPDSWKSYAERKKIKENAKKGLDSQVEENKEDDKKKKATDGMILWTYLLLIPFANPLLTVLCISFMSWVMPDIAEIRNGKTGACYDYVSRRYFVLPFARGTKPGGSYIDNVSNDTVYRVVVDYAFLGEESYNHYSVTDKYAPHSFSLMQSTTFHLMDTIAPVMRSTYSRRAGRRYRTQRVYLTDKEHLQDFSTVDLAQFGLKGNKEVDSIPEIRHKQMEEDIDNYRGYKSIDSLPYPRLRHVSDFNKLQD